MRTFIAVELTPAHHKELQTLQARLSRLLKEAGVGEVVRWTPATNIHLTLRFLGEADDGQRSQLLSNLGEIATAHTRFDLTLTGVGCFPNLRRPSVVWTGVAGRLDRLAQVQRAVEQLARSVGFAADDRPFSPHLTIARMRRDASAAALGKVGEVLKVAAGDPVISRWSLSLPVDAIALIHSDLRPTGPVYTSLGRFDLAPAP